MRIGVFVAAVGLVLAQPVMAKCMGSGPGMVCVSDDGSVWGPGYYGGYYGYPRQKGYGTAPIENRALGSQAAPQNSNTPAVTTDLQPNDQSGNAWLVKPSSGGATVLGQGGGSGAQ